MIINQNIQKYKLNGNVIERDMILLIMLNWIKIEFKKPAILIIGILKITKEELLKIFHIFLRVTVKILILSQEEK